MRTDRKKYDITQCALYKCRTKKRLEQLLKLKSGELKQIADVISYHSFEIEKKNTKKNASVEMRQITAPDRQLKAIQSRILFLLQRVIRPEWLISGEKGKCYIDNGKAHRYSNYCLTIDIKKFYNNCKRDPVFCFFKQDLCTSSDVAKILTDVVTYHGGIPTGCPTSQMLAFYAYHRMFSEINEIAESFACKFTLYVDDMTFSSDSPFNVQLLTRAIDLTLRKYGHRPKYSKIKYYSKAMPKLITGVVITPEHTLAVPNSLQKNIYDDFQGIKHLQKQTVIEGKDKRTVRRLRGRIQAAQNIDGTRFPEISRITTQIEAKEEAPNS